MDSIQMNSTKLTKLNSQITQQFYVSPEGYDRLEKTWKGRIQAGHQPETWELFLYAVLRGKDYRKMFSPNHRQADLPDPYYQARQKLNQLSYGLRFPSPGWTDNVPDWLTDIVQKDALQKVWSMVSQPRLDLKDGGYAV
jgi:hypothetical protein